MNVSRFIRFYFRRCLRFINVYYGKLWPLRSSFYNIFHSNNTIKKRLNNSNIFFVHGTGRSGTRFLSEFLNLQDGVSVYHEPDFFSDIAVLNSSRRNGKISEKYIEKYRAKSIYSRILESKCQTYGEVTGTLRFHVKALMKSFPNSKHLLVIRDGRDVVRSVMPMKFYRKMSHGAYNIKPGRDEEYAEHWDKMSRFEKICWAWDDANRRLLQDIPLENTARFEGLISDYDYFMDKIEKPLGMYIGKELWEKVKDRKSVNSTKSYGFAHYSDWDDEMKESFDRICGETMRMVGYDYTW